MLSWRCPHSLLWCGVLVLGLPAAYATNALQGWICAGMLLGPPVANFVPFPAALMLYGELGLIFLVLSAGLEVRAYRHNYDIPPH